MIITDKFVMINFPKTGSTFARKVLSELYADNFRELASPDPLIWAPIIDKWYCLSVMMPEIEFSGKGVIQLDQHGKWEQIPEIHNNKPVVSIVRNPYDRYVSAFEFNYWKTYLFDSIENIKTEFPTFPELDFNEYLKYQDLQVGYRFPGIKNVCEVGNQTAQFIQYFFNEPHKVFTRLCNDYIYSGDYKRDLPEITFLRNENLNTELWQYLLNIGYSENNIGFILTMKSIRPDDTERLSDNDRNKYFTDKAIAHINSKERFLFRIYKDFGIQYDHLK